MAITLRKAINEDRLKEFIAERDAEAARDGDPKAFDRTIRAMAGTSKSGPETSKPPRSAG
jgi:hypothetical protein